MNAVRMNDTRRSLKVQLQSRAYRAGKEVLKNQVKRHDGFVECEHPAAVEAARSLLARAGHLRKTFPRGQGGFAIGDNSGVGEGKLNTYEGCRVVRSPSLCTTRVSSDWVMCELQVHGDFCKFSLGEALNVNIEM
jgi:hypothetical protein